MKKQKQNKRHHVRMTALRHVAPSSVSNIQPEDILPHLKQAEQWTISLIKDLQLPPYVGLLMLAFYTHHLVTGSASMNIDETSELCPLIQRLWQDGEYTPSPQYPYTLTETLEDRYHEVVAKGDYAAYFQPFQPSSDEPPRGLAQLPMGIVKHPETHIWHIWVFVDHTSYYLGFYRDAITAQAALEALVRELRKGPADVQTLTNKILVYDTMELNMIPFDMMLYLDKHISQYIVSL